MKLRSCLLVLGVVVGGLMLSGCTPSFDPEDIMAFDNPEAVNVNVKTYKVQPPDEIQILSSKVPEIHEAVQRIRPDGKITFEALGEFDVAGKTCEEIAVLVKERTMRLYALAGDYPVDVRVSTFASHYYYILGQVNFPGPRLVTGRDHLLSSIAIAQPTVLAWEQRIRVIRPSYDPESIEPKVFEINLEDITTRGDVSKDVLLKEGDVVYVPPTVLAAVAMKIEEFVRPIGRAFSTVNVVQGP